MKRTILLAITALFYFQAHSQFKGLLNKVKDKVANKVTGQPKQKDTSVQTSQDAPATDPNIQGTAVNTTDETTHKNNSPQPPPFIKTGKTVAATTAFFGIDTEDAWKKLLQAPVVQDYISRLRRKGVTGTDKEVLTRGMQHSEDYTDIQAELQAKYGDQVETFKPSPSLIFAALLNTYKYVMTPNYIRAELGSIDTLNGQGGDLAGGLINALAPGAVTIIDIKAKKMYAVANYLGVLPAAIQEDISGFQDVFGLAAYFKKYMQQPGIKINPVGHKTFHGYNATAVNLEIPVKPTVDENGKPSDGLLFLHTLLSNSSLDLAGKHYDPSYKLYLETYYSHDLDASIPATITADKNVLHVDGFYIGSVLKDEKGNQVVYAIQKIDPRTQIDEGMFLIPPGYEKMTDAQFRQKVDEKFKIKN